MVRATQKFADTEPKQRRLNILAENVLNVDGQETKPPSNFTTPIQRKRILLLAMLRTKVGILLKRKLENVLFCVQIVTRLNIVQMMVRCL